MMIIHGSFLIVPDNFPIKKSPSPWKFPVITGKLAADSRLVHPSGEADLHWK